MNATVITQNTKRLSFMTRQFRAYIKQYLPINIIQKKAKIKKRLNCKMNCMQSILQQNSFLVYIFTKLKDELNVFPFE